MFVSSVVPRTIPTPVSSQEDSIPSTRGWKVPGWAALGWFMWPEWFSRDSFSQCQPHDQGVRAVAVVPPSDVDLLEAEPHVQCLRAGIVRTDLQEHFHSTPPSGFLDQFRQDGGANPLAFEFGHDGDRLDVRDRLDAHQPGVGHDLSVSLSHHVAAGFNLGKFIEEHLHRPRVHRKEPAFEDLDGGNVVSGHVTQASRRRA